MKNKVIIRYKDGNRTTERGECHPMRLRPASDSIEKYWYDVIMEVFSYEKERGGDLQEIHKLFIDSRIADGYNLWEKNKISELVVTDVDVRAVVSGEKDYTVIMKNWKPVTHPRYRWEMVRYMENLFIECSCEDHVINGHYRSNSAMVCKHIAAVMWFLQRNHKMPKFFVTPIEKKWGFERSKQKDLVKEIPGVPLKKFTPYMNIFTMEGVGTYPMKLCYSIHRMLNEPDKYGTEPYKPMWIKFDQSEDIGKIITASIRGYVNMLMNKSHTPREIKTLLDKLCPFVYVKNYRRGKVKVKDYIRMTTKK